MNVFKENTILDIDYIRKHKTRMYNFGLGFIQVVFSDVSRVHYYTDKIPNINDEIHNHRYNFVSKVLKGNFIQKKYILIPGDSHVLTNESCNKERELENVINIPIGVKRVDSNKFCAGEQYSIFYNEFHAVSYIGDTITMLNRSSIITDYAQVIFKKGKEKTCPFSNRMSDDDLYQVIDSVIKS